MRTRATELGRREQYRIVSALPEIRAPSKISPSRLASLNEERRKLRDLVQHLDTRSRRIVLMRVVDDLAFAEIAVKEGIREDNARAIFSRAASKLRTRMPAEAV
jgi:DNA-directed RNA polymerase specialized sigma24 family protein